MQKDELITIRDLYPDLSEEGLTAAEANLRRYVAVLARIHERLKVEGKSWPDADNLEDLTLSGDDFSIPDERSNSTNAINQ